MSLPQSNSKINYLWYNFHVAVLISKKRVGVWRALLTIHVEATDRINEALADAGVLSLLEYDVLLTLYETSDKRLRLSDLAKEALLSRSGITRLVDRLEAQQLLKREVCAADRRGAFAVLTEQGTAALRRTWPVYANSISKYFADHLTEEEIEIFEKAAVRILEALKASRI